MFNTDSFDKILNAPHRLFRLGLSFSLFASLATALLGGCTPAQTSEEAVISLPTATAIASTVQPKTPPIEATATPIPATPTALPTIETPTAEAESHPATATQTLAPTVDPLKLLENEQLITFQPDGVYRIYLDTEQMELLIPNKENWQLFSARISPDGHQVVYWFVEGSMYQVWVTNTIDGESRQLLNMANDEFTNADGEWHGQGRFFELGIRGEDENGVSWVEQWYLFDLLQQEIIGRAINRPGTKICHTLAISPSSVICKVVNKIAN